MNRVWGIYLLSLTLAALLNGCSGTQADDKLAGIEGLAECPQRPNCVSSEARDARHAIAPMQLKGAATGGWDVVRKVVGDLPRTTIVAETDRYLHAECTSRLFGFIDDLELQLDPETGVIAVRSASRIGYSDLGVNRRRVENLRAELKKNGVIH